VVSKRNSDIWYLSKKAGAKPVKIGQQVSEGIAVSKINLKIAFTDMSPKEEGKAFSKLVVADLDLTGGIPKLLNRKTVLESIDPNCTVEAQDFYANDTKLTFFCYIPNGAFDVKGVDLLTKEVTNFSNSPGSFNEPEGIFPGGIYTTVEMDRQCEWLGGNRGSGNLDIWKLKLDGSGKDLVRLTHFNDYEGGKAANPVVSGDGKFMAFQAARSTDPPGVGHGILLYWFTAGTSQVQLKKVTAFKKTKRKESGVK
jgi:Tol biopolymer transport system component